MAPKGPEHLMPDAHFLVALRDGDVARVDCQTEPAQQRLLHLARPRLPHGRQPERRAPGLPARARHRPEQPLGSDQLAASLRAAESASSARPPTGSGFGSGWNPGSGWSSGSGWNPGSGWSSRTGSLARLWLELAGARSSAVALVGARLELAGARSSAVALVEALAVGGFSQSSGFGCGSGRSSGCRWLQPKLGLWLELGPGLLSCLSNAASPTHARSRASARSRSRSLRARAVPRARGPRPRRRAAPPRRRGSSGRARRP